MPHDDKVHPVFSWKIEVLDSHDAAIFHFRAVPLGTVDPDTMQPDNLPAMAFALDGMRRLRDELDGLIQYIEARGRETGLQ
ncbi:hypothetical protein [Lysobacter terrae]